MAWKVYRSRTKEYALFNLRALIELNKGFAEFVGQYMGVCCSIDIMDQGIARRGLLTSNPSEQVHSKWVRERMLAIMDFSIGTLTKMANYQFDRRQEIDACIARGQKIVPKAFQLHKDAIQVGCTLKVLFDVESDSILEAAVYSNLNAYSPTFTVKIRVPGVNGHGDKNCLQCSCRFMVLYSFSLLFPPPIGILSVVCHHRPSIYITHELMFYVFPLRLFLPKGMFIFGVL